MPKRSDLKAVDTDKPVSLASGGEKPNQRTYQALIESRPRIAEVLESIEDGFFTINRDWHYTYVNRTAASAAGLQPGDLIGKNIWECWPQLLGTQLEKYYRQAMQGRLPLNFEHLGVYTGKWYEVRVYPSEEGISVFWIDITDRREMELRLAYHALLLETIHDAVMATDIEQHITAWNRGAEELTGWKANEVLGKKLAEVIKTGDQPALQDQTTWLPLMEGKPVILEVPLYRKDEQEILVETTTMPVFDPAGQLIGYVSAGRDVTEQKQAERDLQQAYNELESRVLERTQELNELHRRLIESTESERLRVSRELHDGPMQELYGLMYQASLLENNLSGAEVQAELKSFIQRIQAVNENLRSIAYHLRPVSLTELGLEKAIREYAARLQVEFPQLELELALQPDRDVLPENHRLALFRVCQVGLMNVVRHSQASQAEVRLVCGRDLVMLEIKDNGLGFEVPRSLLSLARRGHLGLVGAAERVEALGGKLELYSQSGKGTRLIVCLPIQKQAGLP